jgi:4,5-DOPA dioxygenase extradiol
LIAAMTAQDRSERKPALFIGHGSPMNALADNEFTRAWRDIAHRFPKPRAIVCISAHWETKGVLITAAEHQRTIHDFYNLPPELYAITYPAPGAPKLAKTIEALLAPGARADLDSWGLDHGAWSVLRFMYPEADIPVVQVSQDIRRSPSGHYDIGKAIASLRRQNVLVLGSGNIVHNLQHHRGASAPVDWATRFNDAVKAKIAAKDHAALIDYPSLGPDALLAVPEPEHYQPLLYVLATQAPDEPAEYFADTVTGALSMTSVAIGLRS